MKKIILIENFGSDFYKARLSYAKYLKSEGFEVSALVPDDEYAALIENEGIKTYTYPFSRKNKGILQLFRLAKTFRMIFRENAFDVVHSYRFQPNLLNTLSNLFSKRKSILHVTGLGLAFSNTSFKYLALRYISQVIFQLKFLVAYKVIFQNGDDAKDLWFSGLWKSKICVIEGSGVNISTFSNSGDMSSRELFRAKMDVPTGHLVFICTTRLLWEKGIAEMIETFLVLQKENISAQLWIVGWSDEDNPRHVDTAYIDQFSNNTAIKFLGKRADIKQLLEAADVFLYPSYYREGIPRSVLEALAMGLPIITTKMPGCKLTVVENENGFLIGTKSSDEILNAIQKIRDLPNLDLFREKSRQIAETRFSNEIIFKQIKNLY